MLTPMEGRAAGETMIWPDLNPDGTGEARTLFEDERRRGPRPETAERLPPHPFGDPSFTAQAVKVLAPAPP